MPTLTIRNLPEELVRRVRSVAQRRGRIEQTYASRKAVLAQVEESWRQEPHATAVEIEAWIQEGRE